MLYSRFDSSTGLYDYYEAPAGVGMNDDLPVPAMPAGTELGVPSTECGRALPENAVHVGQGKRAAGSITPPAGTELFGITETTLGGGLVWFFVGAATVGILWLSFGSGRKRAG